jgi:hypothetical protein
VGCFVDTWKGDCLGSSSRGQPRGALPLHQVTHRQFIKFADPTRRSGHNNLLQVLPRHVHIIWGRGASDRDQTIDTYISCIRSCELIADRAVCVAYRFAGVLV